MSDENFKTRGIDAEKAIKCCKEKVEEAYNAVKNVENEMQRLLEIIENTPVEARPVIAAPAQKVIAEIGSLIGLNWASGKEHDIKELIETLAVPIKVAYSKLRKLRDSCEDCIKNGIWNQSKPQHVVTEKSRKRG